jgi:predicted nucleic acid-binding protein
MILIADSSALIALSVCNQLELLTKMFESICIPLSVFNEINIPDKPESKQLSLFLKDKITDIELSSYIISTPRLGKGELEAMALYKKLNADYLLTDDKQARKIAEYNNIRIIGSIGILILAKKQGLIRVVKPSLVAIYHSYIYISEELYQHVLKLVNED